MFGPTRGGVHGSCAGISPENSEPGGSPEGKEPHMGYGIVGILVIILIVLAIIYFAKRV